MTPLAPPGLIEASGIRAGGDVCRSMDPTPWALEGVAYELDLLDAWTFPPASSIRVPAVTRDPGDRRVGIFVEARVDGRISRDGMALCAASPSRGRIRRGASQTSWTRHGGLW